MSCIVHVKPELYKWKDRVHKAYTDCKTEETSQIVGLEFFAMKLKVTKPFGINFSIDFSCRGVLWILSDKDDQRFWGGLKFLIPGFLGGRKIWQVYFSVAWFKSRFLRVFFMILVHAFWKFLRLGNSTLDGLLWGVNFWSICGFVESPRDFVLGGGWFLLPFDHPLQLESRLPPPPPFPGILVI